MRYSTLTYSILLVALCGWFTASAQIDSRSALGLPLATTVQMNNISSPALGSILFNTDDGYIYRHTASGWLRIVGTDNQQITEFSLDGSNLLTLSLEDGGSQTVDLSALNDVGTDDQSLSLNDASLSIEDGNSVDLRSLRNTDDQDAFRFVSTDGTTGERDVFTVEDQDNGGGSQDHSSVLKVLKSGNITSADLGFSLIEATYTGASPGADKYFIAGRTSDEGAPVFGVEISTANIWTEGRLYVGATGNADGTYTEGNFTVRATGEIRSTDLAGVGDRMVVADATGTLATQPIPAFTDTDDQDASEVNLTTPADLDGDGNNESTVEEAIQDMAPIVSKAARIFYPPSISIDVSSTGTGFTRNLYTDYTDQYGTPQVASPGAPAAIPTYAADELYYYVTEFDSSVFSNVSISSSGVLSYDVISVPSDYNTIINVVFVVR